MAIGRVSTRASTVRLRETLVSLPPSALGKACMEREYFPLVSYLTRANSLSQVKCFRWDDSRLPGNVS
jgi:hypothetical protein